MIAPHRLDVHQRCSSTVAMADGDARSRLQIGPVWLPLHQRQRPRMADCLQAWQQTPLFP